MQRCESMELKFNYSLWHIKSKIDDWGTTQMSEVICKDVKMKSLNFKSEISDKINFIEKWNEAIKVSRRKEINHIDIRLSLLELKKCNDDNKLSVFHNLFPSR